MTPALRLRIISIFLTLLTQAPALDSTIQRFKESPDLHYEHVGEAQLYNTEWKIVTYINLEEADYSLETVKKYTQLSIEFCEIHEHTR
jgi:hypothetical protein